MSELCETVTQNFYSTYKFWFDKSSRSVDLTREQLDAIPYLAALVRKRDDLKLAEYDNREFVLEPSLNYDLFMVSLRAMISKQPYVLFNELPEDNNIFDLFDFWQCLGIRPSLDRSKENNSATCKFRSTVDDHEANDTSSLSFEIIAECRNTAAKFILDLYEKKYNLDRIDIAEGVCSLITIIYSNADVFSSRFRYHALGIVRQYCLPYLSEHQKCAIPTSEQIIQSKVVDSWIYIHDNDVTPTKTFENACLWISVYRTIKTNTKPIMISKVRPKFRQIYKSDNKSTTMLSTEIQSIERPPYCLLEDDASSKFQNRLNIFVFLTLEVVLSKIVRIRAPKFAFLDSTWTLFDNRHRQIGGTVNNQLHATEAMSARSGRFNTQPERPNIDKFKNRFNNKRQNYR